MITLPHTSWHLPPPNKLILAHVVVAYHIIINGRGTLSSGGTSIIKRATNSSAFILQLQDNKRNDFNDHLTFMLGNKNFPTKINMRAVKFKLAKTALKEIVSTSDWASARSVSKEDRKWAVESSRSVDQTSEHNVGERGEIELVSVGGLVGHYPHRTLKCINWNSSPARVVNVQHGEVYNCHSSVERSLFA